MSTENTPNSNKNKFILIALVALLAVGAFVIFSGKDEPKKDESPVTEFTQPEVEDVIIEEPVQEEIIIPEPEPIKEETKEETKNLIEPPKKDTGFTIKPALSEEEQAKEEALEKRREQKKFTDALKKSPTQVQGGSGVIVDQIITPAFVENIAFYFVENYIPPMAGDSTGEIAINPEEINTHYGVELTGLPGSGNAYYVREILLDFVYQPSNFNTLYLLYAEKILDDMIRASSQPHNNRAAFTVDQQEAMLYDYAKYIFSAGHSVQTILNMPNLEQIFATKNELENKLVKNRARFAKVQTAYEEARMNEEEANAETLKEEMFLLADLIGVDQAALTELYNQVVFAHGNTDKQVFPASDMIYIFGWLGRRHAQDPENFMEASRDLEDAAFKVSADFVTKAKLLQ